MLKLLIATRNPGKFREYVAMLRGVPFELTSLDREGIDLEVEETGKTFEENAVLKATYYARSSGLLTLADDSGLEVDYLDGEPGVLSARYAGAGATDEERFQLLLKKLAGVPLEQRTARFRCAIAVADPAGAVKVVDGRLDGLIAFAPRGTHGFGYDPVFFVPDRGTTLAELTSEEKNQISHRAKAATRARQILVDLSERGRLV